MTALPLIAAADLEAPFAWQAGRPIPRRRYLADVAALAARLAPTGAALPLGSNRYRFAVALGAAMARGHVSLLPPNHTADTVARLRALWPDAYALADEDSPQVDLPVIALATAHAPADATVASPLIPTERVVARVLTSGSTGAPVPHAKPWGLLVANARAAATRLAEAMGRGTLEGATLVATVPPQHMYGFESSVLLALVGGAAFDVERPFYPADVAAALERLPRPRLLVTTPFHLKTVVDSQVLLPACDLVLCATAPLAPQLAARAEAAFAAPLHEIYGCTEAGQVATRRTVAGPEWRTFDGLVLSGDGERTQVAGGHVPEPTLLADVLERLGPQRFRLLGRSNDLVNVAGKRSSLGHLNFHLNAIAGVQDGAFWMPPDGSDGEVVRLVAFVAAPDVSDAALRAALRERVDPAFLPRRIVRVAALPRDPTGKLPAARLAALAESLPQSAAAAGPGAHPEADS